MNYLMATQANVEQVKVLCAFRSETWADGHRGHIAQSAEVKGQRAVALCVGEGAVAVAARVFLKETIKIKYHIIRCTLESSTDSASV